MPGAEKTWVPVPRINHFFSLPNFLRNHDGFSGELKCGAVGVGNLNSDKINSRGSTRRVPELVIGSGKGKNRGPFSCHIEYFPPAVVGRLVVKQHHMVALAGWNRG